MLKLLYMIVYNFITTMQKSFLFIQFFNANHSRQQRNNKEVHENVSFNRGNIIIISKPHQVDYLVLSLKVPHVYHFQHLNNVITDYSTFIFASLIITYLLNLFYLIILSCFKSLVECKHHQIKTFLLQQKRQNVFLWPYSINTYAN